MKDGDDHVNVSYRSFFATGSLDQLPISASSILSQNEASSPCSISCPCLIRSPSTTTLFPSPSSARKLYMWLTMP